MKRAGSLVKNLTVIILTLFAACNSFAARIIYVDGDAPGLNNGSSWENAYVYLQDALADANDSNKPVEIRVAQGTHTPDQGANITPGDPNATFQLINGVTISGGYAGVDANDPNTRDIELYETILSGDLLGDDEGVVDLKTIFDETSRYDNSYNVVTAEHTDETAVLDGVNITAGIARSYTHVDFTPGPPRNDRYTRKQSVGGGMYCYEAGPVIANCTFELNAARLGGGIYNYTGEPNIINCCFVNNAALGSAGGGLCNDSGKPVLTGCEFIGNFASSGAGISDSSSSDMIVTNCTFSENSADYGGGIDTSLSSNLSVKNCKFSKNSACEGGGIYNYNSTQMLSDCNFVDNSSELSGGGMYNHSGTSTFINCTFEENTASVNGGGIFNEGLASSMLSLTNCIFIRNSARYGGALVGGGSRMIMGLNFNNISTINNNPSIISLLNCTFNGNVADISGGGISVTILSDILISKQVSSLTIVNCILWGNTPDEIKENIVGSEEDVSELVTVIYSNVQGGFPGQGNIDVDPLFVNPGYWADINDPNIIVEPNDPNAVWIDGDYHLKSQAGRWNPTTQSWVIDDVTSPCIDIGDPNSPVGDEPFPNGGIINMGAYGGTTQAGKSYTFSKIIYVDDDAAGTNDGSSWEDAYTYLQDALADANSTEKPVEIRVAQGTYKPNQGININMLPFLLINEVTLAGGYAGLAEQDPNERNFERYETILSGDLEGNDIDVNNPRDLLDEPTRSDNIPIIYSGYSIDQTAVLDGFIITGGCNRAVPFEIVTGGGGIKIDRGSSPTISNCTLIGNAALACGGGMLTRKDSNPTIINCKFIENYAGSGGGVFNVNSSPTFLYCSFSGNSAEHSGAGMYSLKDNYKDGTNSSLIDCIFENNSAYYSGGGLCVSFDETILTDCVFICNSVFGGMGGSIYNKSGSIKINDCTFIGNYASYNGGGLASSDDANSIITSCVFIGNSTRSSGGGIAGFNSIYNSTISGNVAINNGGGIYGWGETINCTIIGNKAKGNGGGIFTQGTINLANCIVRNNRALIGNEIYSGLRSVVMVRGEPPVVTPSALTVKYSNIKGLDGEIPKDSNCIIIWEPVNIDTEAYFAEPGNWDSNGTSDDPNDDFWIEGDYHLKSQAGRWYPASETWVIDDMTSPCIDAGDPNSPIGDEPFPNGGIINMGTYGGTAKASKSYLGE